MWVAKISDKLGVLFDYELSPRFHSIYDCQDYINANLKDIEDMISMLFKACDFLGHKFVIRFGSYIRCYNTSQKRFADGFDY